MKVLVLCHGVLGFGSEGLLNFIPVTYFKNIASSIKSSKILVLEPSVAAIGTIATRASELIQYINEKTDAGDKLYFIAHSMGGLDVMHALPELDAQRKVKAVATIGTPYGGSEVADVIHQKVDNPITRAIPLLFRPFLQQLTETALKELTTTESKQRNLLVKVPDHVAVTLIAGNILGNQSASLLFDLASAIGGIDQVRNDGVVTMTSALPEVPAGKSNITVIPEPWAVDHAGEIGWFVDSREHLERYHALIETMTGIDRKYFVK